VDYDAYREIMKKPRYWCNISKALWEFSNQYSIVIKQCQSCGWRVSNANSYYDLLINLNPTWTAKIVSWEVGYLVRYCSWDLKWWLFPLDEFPSNMNQSFAIAQRTSLIITPSLLSVNEIINFWCSSRQMSKCGCQIKELWK